MEFSKYNYQHDCSPCIILLSSKLDMLQVALAHPSLGLWKPLLFCIQALASNISVRMTYHWTLPAGPLSLQSACCITGLDLQYECTQLA